MSQLNLVYVKLFAIRCQVPFINALIPFCRWLCITIWCHFIFAFVFLRWNIYSKHKHTISHLCVFIKKKQWFFFVCLCQFQVFLFNSRWLVRFFPLAWNVGTKRFEYMCVLLRHSQLYTHIRRSLHTYGQ